MMSEAGSIIRFLVQFRKELGIKDTKIKLLGDMMPSPFVPSLLATFSDRARMYADMYDEIEFVRWCRDRATPCVQMRRFRTGRRRSMASSRSKARRATR